MLSGEVVGLHGCLPGLHPAYRDFGPDTMVNGPTVSKHHGITVRQDHAILLRDHPKDSTLYTTVLGHCIGLAFGPEQECSKWCRRWHGLS